MPYLRFEGSIFAASKYLRLFLPGFVWKFTTLSMQLSLISKVIEDEAFPITQSTVLDFEISSTMNSQSFPSHMPRVGQRQNDARDNSFLPLYE